MYVKKELAKQGVFVVFLKTVREVYNSSVCENGEEGNALKDDRSLKKYIQPSLAAAEIHLMLGALKVGSFFCTSKKFTELAAKAKNPSQTPLSMTPEQEGPLYDKFGEYIRSHEKDITLSLWHMSEFIRAIPALLWWKWVETTWVQSSYLKRRCRGIASLRNTPYNEQWPCISLLCPEDLKTLPNHEFTFVLSVYFGIERTVFLRSSRRTRGPIVSSLSLISLTNTNISYLSILNRLGCVASYQLLDTWRNSVIDERKRNGAFQELKLGAFVAVGIDNVTLRAGHSLNIHGSTYFGFDGLAMQAVNPNESFDFEAYCDFLSVSDPDKLRPKEIELPDMPLYSTRPDFTRDHFPSRSNDPDIVGFKWLCTGLAVAHDEDIATDDESRQQSFRRVILDSLDGFTGGKARVEYITVRGCNPNEEYEIIKLLECIEDQFNPFNADRMTFVAAEGDQPIFKILFKLWMMSVIKKTRLHRWMIPIPGGFHIDKQGLIALLKILLSGSGLEELVVFNGLPKKKQESIVTYGHYRKSRRLLSQITAAELIRIAEVMADLDPDLKEDIRRLKEEIERECKLSQRERHEVYRKTNRSAQIKPALPTGCELAVADSVSPKVIEIGRRIVDAVKKVSEDSMNMNFFGEFQLFDMLLPWNAYNILTRKGMTKLVDKFWFSYVGLMHVTNKLNYQENMLMYAIVKASMPEAARHVLYDKGYLVINMHETVTDTNVAHDDCVESKIIRDTKRMNTNDRKTVESSPPVSMALGRAQSSIDKELCPVVRSGLLEPENQQPTEPKKKRDREAKTALNVLKMLQFLRSRHWLGEDHRRSPDIFNVFREPWFVISNPSFFEQYVNSEETGRQAAALHLGAKFYQLFGTLTDEELKRHFDNKPLKAVQDRWTKKFMIKTMANMEPAKVGSKRGRSCRDVLENRMTKRMKLLYNVKGALSKIINTAAEKNDLETMAAARVILRDVESNDHVLSSKCFAYRLDLSSEKPYHSHDNFLFAFQKVLSKKGYLVDSEAFLTRDLSPSSLSVVAIHLDITSEVKLAPSLKMKRTTVGEAVYDKVERFLKPFVQSSVHRSVQEFHIHVDVTNWLPLQHSAKTEEETITRNSVSADECEEDGEQYFGMCQTWNPMKATWSHLLSDSGNFTFVRYLHAASGAKAAMLMRRLANTNRAGKNDRLGTMEREIGCTVFLHGTAIAVTKEARKCSLTEITFLRMRDKVILAKKTGTGAPSPPIFGDCTEIDSYGAECCWKVTEMGFERYPSGDSAHGESQTRIIHSIGEVTCKRLSNAGRSLAGCRILVRSWQLESPLIAAVSNLNRDLNIVHQLNEPVVDVRSMRRAFIAAGIQAEDVILLYALSGCSLTASTHHIPQGVFVDAFFGLDSSLRQLYFPEIMSPSPRDSEHWLKFQNLVATAYLLKYKRSDELGARMPDRMEVAADGTIPSSSKGHQHEWISSVQKWVAENSNVMKPCQLMPAPSDVELQGRRAVWVLKYWRSANNYSCNVTTVGGAEEQFGYLKKARCSLNDLKTSRSGKK